jgi:hypothetical protein
MSEISFDSVSNAAKDALYVTVGLGVIAFQKAQVRRQELKKQLEAQYGDARQNVQKATKAAEERLRTVEERLEGLEARWDEVLDQVEQRLPDQAREGVHQARTAAKDARDQLRGLVASRNGNGKA